ncbi:MAG: phosphotransferase, partial [Gracilimonas sp.]|nr:phosphotransferase [Gracilimonas sp.]
MSELSKQKLLSLIGELLPQVELTGEIERLSGGNINFVWRAEGKEKNLILKYAPPHIATDPNVPLSEKRIDFEARVLRNLGKGGSLHSITKARIRPPEWYGFDPEHSLLIMEDVGHFKELQKATGSPQKIGMRLGRFIGKLHRSTYQDQGLKENFHNIEIQKVRNQLQYQPAHNYLGSADSEVIEAVKEKCQDLGKRLFKPGKCLVMGDLWPPSVFVRNEDELRLIDWEFVHYGRPIQDVAHFAAHCWMWSQTNFEENNRKFWMTLWESFWRIYQNTLGTDFEKLCNKGELRDFNIHAGAEILIRANGAFRSGYVYDRSANQKKLRTEAIETAIALILGKQTLFDW